jgi:TM2 domain-containing membrane protein YozV
MAIQSNKSSYSFSVNGEGKNLVVAYLLWWFLGFIGLHRIYLNKKATGITFIVLFILGFITLFIAWIPLGIWWLLDAYFVYKYVTQFNELTSTSGLLDVQVNSNQSHVSNDKLLNKNKLEILERLHSLYEKGALSKEEYESQKKEVI